MYKPVTRLCLSGENFHDREVLIAVNAIAKSRDWDVLITLRILLLQATNKINREEDIDSLSVRCTIQEEYHVQAG